MINDVNLFQTIASVFKKPHVKIALIYFIISFLWIVYSDKIIFSTNQDIISIEYYQLIKGIFFVTGTAILIYFLISGAQKKVSDRNLELTASKEKLSVVLDNLPVGVYYLTVTGEFLYGNKVAEEICGYKSEELIGKNFLKLQLLSPKDIITVAKLLSLNALGKPTGPDEFIINKKDGNKVYTEINTHLIKLADQHVVLGVVKDITENKRTEKEQQENNKRIEGFLKISQAITTTFELPVHMQMIVDKAVSIMNLGSGAVYLLSGENLHLSATFPALPKDFPNKFRTAPLDNHPHIKKTIYTGKHVIMHDSSMVDLTSAEQEIIKLRNLRSILYLPIRLRDESIGILILSSIGEVHKFEEKDINLLQGFADQAAHIIDNIRNYQKAKQYALELEKQIAERKLAESKIRASESKFRNLFENDSAAKLIIDPVTSKIINANLAAAKFYGYTVNELENMNISQINVLSDTEIKNEMEKARKAQKIYFEFQHRKSDGAIIDVEVYCSKIELNEKDYIHCIIHDITGRKKAERDLKASEERLALATKGAGIGIWDYKIKDDKLEWNDVMFELFDIDKDNFGGTLNDWKKCLLPDALPEALSIFDEALKEKNEFYIEFPIMKRDGKIYYLVGSGIIKRNDSNEVVRVIGINYDITKRKKIENQLRDNEIKYKTIADYNYDWEYWLDTNKKYIYNSPSCERITGYSREELGNDLQTTINIIHPDDKETVSKHYNEEQTKRNELENIEFRIITKDGETRWISHICRIVHDENNNIIGVRGSNRDITEEKEYKIELEKRSHAIEQSPVSIIITDITGNIEYVNPMFTKVSGYTFEEVKGKNPRILKSGEQTNEFYRNMWLTITSGNIWTGVFHNKKKDGELFWESAIISPIKNEKKEITNFVAVKEDITEDVKRDLELKKYRENLEELVKQRTKELHNVNIELQNQLDRSKLLETQLQESLSKEKEINELKTRFIATVSHEFRTPLSALLSSSQMIQRYSKNWSEEKLAKHYSRIESTVKYLTEMLDDVLTISRADRDILKNNPELTDINELLNSFVDEVKSQITESHQLYLDINCINKKVFIDKKLLRHVVVNLLSNAVKYSPPGSDVKLNTKCNEDNLFISVSDQGIGISKDEIKYIFDAFYRTKNSIGVQGTGLGLNIVKRALNVMKGDITVKSEENIGTTFAINIPINYDQKENKNIDH